MSLVRDSRWYIPSRVYEMGIEVSFPLPESPQAIEHLRINKGIYLLSNTVSGLIPLFFGDDCWKRMLSDEPFIPIQSSE
jgi:hypothetical protein